jgi:peptidoglycan/xylan/chitin deacetylase (PgdA/CDA1 family)
VRLRYSSTAKYATDVLHILQSMVDVFITVDVECSMGGAWDNPAVMPVPAIRAVLGEIDGRYFGTPLIMDVLERYALKGVFFVEVFASRNVDSQELAAGFRQIVDRAHDIQLHLHPTHFYYSQVRTGAIPLNALPAKMDLLGSHPIPTQRELLRLGKAMFTELTGRTPIAFRAGNYGASKATLEVLFELGFGYDSSYNAAYLGTNCLMNGAKTNAPWRSAVWEYPVTCFETGMGVFRRLKSFEVAAISFQEMRSVLEFAYTQGLPAVTIVLHSFAFLKRYDLQYRRMRPDRVVINRFERLCAFLASRPNEYRVTTYASRPTAETCTNLPFPRVSFALSAVRKCVQVLNR